ncbi:MAG TPA: nuclear transport factor 2 family protein [Verrucomicrobiae bacterium]|nr:nuclear transport factor 2 family protein [Verrucomicrobiae bacterium]
MKRILGKARGKNWIAGVAALLIFALAPASARAQKKNKNNNSASAAAPPIIPLPIPEQIDTEIGQMLGAFQLGEVEKMHQYYAENASFVSGAYAPPVMGWQNYAAAYERDRGLFQGMQVVRRNTSIFHSGDVAWACYQWELSAQYEGKPYFARGQTTLVFVKTGDTWLIVHNHTSQICPNEASRPKPPASNPANAPAAKP